MTRRLALTVALALICPLTLPAVAPAADPIMPLASVRSGMACKGYSVVRGTEIASFDVAVLDVVAGDATLPGPRILVRVSGAAVEPHGIASGFSGSPVYCRDSAGRMAVAGAIADTIGEFGNKVGLATPIEEVLGERPDAPPGTRSRPDLLRRARPVGSPLTVTGLSGETLGALRRAGARSGRAVVAAPAGPLASFPRQSLVRGASVAAAIASGDVGLAGIGTVTYRDGPALWAFGHPLDGAGRRSLLLQDAYVFTVVNQPAGTEEASSFKLAAPGHDLGSFTNDALGALVGRVGTLPRTLPLTVTVRDLDTGRVHFSDSRLADETELDLATGLPLVGSLALSQGQTQVLRSTPPRQTSTICVRFQILQRARPIGFCGTYFDGQSAIDAYGNAAGLVDGFDRGPYRIVSARADLQVRRGVRELFLRRGSITPRRVRPGQRVRVRIVTRGRRGGTRRISFRLRIPRSLRPGNRALVLRGESDSDQGELEATILRVLVGGGGDSEADVEEEAPPPATLGELARRVAALRAVHGLRGGFRSRSRSLLYRADTTLFRGRVRIPLRVVRRAARRR